MKKKIILLWNLAIVVVLSGCLNDNVKEDREEASAVELSEIEISFNETDMEQDLITEDISFYTLQKEAENAFQDFLAGSDESSNLYWILEKYEGNSFGYYDINGDEIDELIIKAKGGVLILMYYEGDVCVVCNLATNYSAVLLENGMVWYHRPGVAPLHDYYQVFSLEGTEYQRMCTFEKDDGNLDGYYDENGEGDIYLYNSEEILKEEWDELIQPYVDCEEAILHDTGILIK